MSSQPFQGKLAIVTGASRGIGAAIARHLGAKGCNILGVYTSDSSKVLAEDICSELAKDHNVTAFSVKADLNQPQLAASVIIEAARQHFGGPGGDLRVDILVNNAGVGGDYALGEVPVEEFHRMYAVNVLAPIMVTQAVLPYLPNDRSGRIINISSVASAMGFATHTLYGGTKAALEAMTRTWARELAERATVNAVNPGPVSGDMYYASGEKLWKQLEPYQLNCPLSAVREGVDDPDLIDLAKSKMAGRRPAYASEVAGVVGMLCSTDAAWCTGSVVCANGGFKFGV
ncbi:putative short chain dehydrogenase/ reductase [Aspergillus heterothallicus]